MSEWIKVEYNKPNRLNSMADLYDDVLIYFSKICKSCENCGSFQYGVGYLTESGIWVLSDYDNSDPNNNYEIQIFVTHWQPLPKKPLETTIFKKPLRRKKYPLVVSKIKKIED